MIGYIGMSVTYFWSCGPAGRSWARPSHWALPRLRPNNPHRPKPPTPTRTSSPMNSSKIRSAPCSRITVTPATLRQKWAELRLDSREAMLQGGKSGPAILPGDPDGSLLIKAVRQQNDNLKMPLGRKLEASQIAVFAEWVRMGAPWPETNAAPPAPAAANKGFTITDAQRSFWSFQPLKEPAPPAIAENASWARTPIDHFVLAKLRNRIWSR